MHLLHGPFYGWNLVSVEDDPANNRTREVYDILCC